MKKQLLKMLIVVSMAIGLMIAMTMAVSAATQIGSSSTYYEIDGATMTITGEGTIPNDDTLRTAIKDNGITTLVIDEGITEIDMSAFRSCTSLASVTIPSTVTSIGSYAFRHCSGLTSVTIPEGVESIGTSAFYQCTNLASVTIPSTVKSISKDVFIYCNSLGNKSIQYASTKADWEKITGSNLINEDKVAFATQIGTSSTCYTISGTTMTITGSGEIPNDDTLKSAISNNNITTLVISEGITEIGMSAFHSCSKLTSVTIPSTVTAIGASAFRQCTSLTSVTIPEGVESIGEYAFGDCTNLTTVTIPSTVTSIGTDVFENCTSLGNKSIQYASTKADWDKITGSSEIDESKVAFTESGSGSGSGSQGGDSGSGSQDSGTVISGSTEGTFKVTVSPNCINIRSVQIEWGTTEAEVKWNYTWNTETLSWEKAAENVETYELGDIVITNKGSVAETITVECEGENVSLTTDMTGTLATKNGNKDAVNYVSSKVAFSKLVEGNNTATIKVTLN